MPVDTAPAPETTIVQPVVPTTPTVETTQAALPVTQIVQTTTGGLLDEYVRTTQEMYAPKREPATPSTPVVEPPKETKEPEASKEATSVTPAAPSTFGIDALLKDPNAAPSLNQALDKRAAALAKAQADRVRAEETARLESEARAKADRDFNDLISLANSDDDLDDDVIEARKKVAARLQTTKLKETWERAELPTIKETVAKTAVAGVLDNLGQGYAAAYNDIPELSSNPQIAAAVHHNQFATSKDWLVNLVNTVADARVAAKDAELRAAYARDVKEQATAQTTQQLADARSSFPRMDIAPQTGGVGGGGAGGSGTVVQPSNYMTQVDAEAAYLEGKVTANYVRWARKSLPYQ